MVTFQYVLFCAALLCFTTEVTGAENQWAWMRGSSDPAPAFYTEPGVPAEENAPPGLGFAARWTDNDGNFWLFGGTKFNQNGLCSLWKLDAVSKNWAYMRGSLDTTERVLPVYGTKGVEASENHPGSRFKSVTWTDTQGNLWLYGGVGANKLYGDLWKLDPKSLQWTWVHGSEFSYLPAKYGSLGIPSPDNNPGSRYGSAGWADDGGNFWLIGGVSASNGWLNDLWKYSVELNQWAWMGGTQKSNALPEYGFQGVPSPDNIPGARSDSATWRDPGGNFWLFGGYGKTSHTDETTTYTFGPLNDIWKYNPLTAEWTWVSGSRLTGQPGNNGIRGVPDFKNHPGARYNISAVVDHYDQVWIMGGTGGGNELWCYNMESNLWTWVHGGGENQYGVYGTRGNPAPENTPGARSGASTWLDVSGNLWLFGSYHGRGATAIGDLNDTWAFTPGYIDIPAHVEDWFLFE